MNTELNQPEIKAIEITEAPKIDNSNELTIQEKVNYIVKSSAWETPSYGFIGSAYLQYINFNEGIEKYSKKLKLDGNWIIYVYKESQGYGTSKGFEGCYTAENEIYKLKDGCFGVAFFIPKK